MKQRMVSKLAVLLAALMALSACGAQTAGGTGVAPSGGEGTQITHIAYLDTPSSSAVSPEGLYEACQIRPGGCNLFYVDAASGQETYLCAAPNCTHDSSDCTFYLPIGEGEYGYTLFFFSDHLYAIQNTATKEHGPYLMQMDPDGTNRKTVLELEDGETFFGSVFGYGDSILCEIDQVDENGTWHRQLERIDPQAGTRELLFGYPEREGESYTLMGAAGPELIYLCSTGAQNQYCKVDLSQGGASLNDWQSSTLGPPFDNATLYCNLQGDYFCTFDRETNTLGYENLLTGETKEFPAPALAPGETLYGLAYLYDDQFALTLDDAEGNVVHALIDRQSGELTGVRYIITKENAFTILGGFGDSLLYLTRIDQMPLKNQGEQGLMDELGYYSVYSIVSKADFEAGKPGQEIPFPEG